jgi:hypothetical protein
MTNNDDVEKLCEAVLEALPRLAADPSLTLMERTFLQMLKERAAER